MNMHVDFGAQDWELQHRAANIASCDRLLTLLMWKHPEQMRFNPRLLPAPRINISPIVEGYMAARKFHLQLRRAAVAQEIALQAPPTIDEIQRAVCRHYGLTRNDLLSDRRTHDVCRPRQVGMYLAKRLTPKSYPYIGHRFGGRDHATAINAVRKIESLSATDPVIAKAVQALTRQLGGLL